MSDLLIPQHVAIIMDGNGRFAKKFFLTKAAGHRAGAQTLKQIVRDAEALSVKFLTVYAFSTENWKRSPKEVEDLLSLLREYIKNYINDVDKNDIRIKCIGDINGLPSDLAESIRNLERISAHKEGLQLNLAINYGSKDEIIRAVKSVCSDILSDKLSLDRINEDVFEQYLDTCGIPPVDLCIRTSGEMRLSNFLLWQLAYAELFFIEKHWPEFKKADLLLAFEAYSKRERRFGGR